MKGRSLLALPALAFALACEGNNQPTGPGVPTDPSAVISDGAHSGNPDFFFLPPLVPNPVNDPNYEPGKFNASLQPSLTVEICELQGAPVDAQGLPVATDCVAGPPVKKFPAGTVRLQNPPDGFYQVVWNTRESNLDVTKFYRIKVLVEGLAIPFGVADVDPVSNMKELRNARTGETIPLNDDSTLPINFRVEHGGGPTLCGTASLCNSVTVTNNNPNGDYQIVRVEGNDVPIAGALLPDGWLPPDGPQSVVFTISRVNTGANDIGAGTQEIPCHANLPLQQFDGCFHFSTIPELPVINEAGNQFARAITLAVCFVLVETEDTREPWVQLWSSDPGEDAKPLPSAPDGLILTNPQGRTCDTGQLAANNSNTLSRFASAGWRQVKGGLGRLFGVQTAYAVDLGLGGLALDISNVGPALTAQIQRYTSTGLTLGPGSITTSTARIVGTRLHNGGVLTTGIGGLAVTFTVAPGNGTLRLIGSEAPPATQLTSITNTNPIDPESPVSGGGFAPVNWTMPTVPGTYTLTATGPATGGPVTFTAIVSGDPPTVPVSIDGVLSTGEWSDAAVFNFTAKVPGGGTTPATLYVKNDDQNLYLAVRYARTTVDTGGNRLGFEFDNNNDGLGPANGDDYFVFQQSSPSVFSDAFRSGGGASVTTDTQSDGAGAFHNDGTYSVYEISHPLNSGQAGQDFALTGGSTIGLFFQLIIGGVTTTYPGPFIEYAPITITGGIN